ncbi:unnamed protein product [Clonostachys rosea f. rosea IK726]|uniref:Uncharacterized protein n=1 Tax=Clonostachys rosea f. rosea IK726 TaxID=1349383 RepID=A0ACA9UCB4_BIOOC|nr:unnamed protein product [Clonostachys rosea f. rosea IK726]
MKTASTAAFAASLVASASAFGYNEGRTFATVQFTNNHILQARIDPIVSPGKIASHVHTILGGSNFGMSSTGEDLLKSNCTNANVKGDMSNYWFPLLYFQDPQTGKLEPVEVFYPKVYYFFEKTHDVIKAFPVGLNMLVGDPMKRTPPSTPEEILTTGSGQEISNVHVTCPRDEKVTDDNKYPTGPSWPVDSDGTNAGIGSQNNPGAGVGFPFRNCDGYAAPLRMDIHFPSCLKKNADLKDYKNNMNWPKSVNGGYQDCAEDEIHVPHLFMEVYWNTPLFKDRWDHSGNGPQPFVLASGDRTGYSWHADFMAGWDTDILQNVIDNCNTGNSGMLNCPGVEENKDKCIIETPVDEVIGGVLDQLPGNNPISGWGVGTNPQPQPSGSSSSSAAASSTAAASSSSAASSSTSASAAASSSSSSASAASSSAQGASSGLPGSSDDATKVIENPAVSTSSAVAVETSGAPQSSSAAASQSPSTKTKKPKSTCALKTVYETVTVTAPASGAVQSQAAHARRHEHERLMHRHAGHRH